MKRRSPSLPKSIFKSRAFLRRPSKRAALTLALALLWLNQHVGAANTQYNVKNSSTDLTATGTYTTGGTLGTGAGGAVAGAGPTVTSDVTFDSGVTYSPAAFTLNSSVTFGSLNDLSTTTLTIANTSASGTGDTLTLGGSGDPGSSEPGAANGDLFFVGTGATLNINSGAAGTATALGIVLGQSGNFDVAGTSSISAIISGAGFGITKTGAGTLTLSGANTFSGGLTETAGTVNAQSVAALGTGAFGLGASSGTASATLQYNGGSNFTVANAINVNAGSSGTLQITATSGAPTLSGLITLSNNLLLTNTNSVGANSLNVTGGIAGTGNVTFSATSAGGSVISGTALTFTGTLSNTSTGGAGFGISANLTAAEALLQNSASSTTTVSGTNTYTGGTTINLGLLEFTKTASMPTSSTATLNTTVNAGGTLGVAVGGTGQFAATGTGPGTLAGIFAGQGTGTSTVTLNSGSTVGVDTGSGSVTYAGNITNSGVGLTKLGANTLTLTGTNTYTGPTTITAGMLQIGGTGSLGGGNYAASISNAGTLEYSSSAAQTLSGSIGGAGALTKDTSATSTLTLSGVNTFTGATTVTAGTLDLANSLALQNSAVGFSGTGAITFDSAVTSNAFTFGALTASANNSYVLQNNATTSAPITLTIGNPQTNASSATSGVFSGSGNLTVAGFSNTLTLTGANTYTGTTTITGATLNLGGAGSNGSIGTTAAGVTTGGPLVLGGADSGGVLAFTRTGTVSQAFTGTTINPGQSSITTSTATQTLNLGALSGNAGGTVDINPNTTSTITTATRNTNGIIGGYATFAGKTTWAVAPATAGGAITGLPTASYSQFNTAASTFAPGSTANVDIQASNTTAATTQTVNSLRFNQAAAQTLTLAGTGATGSLLTVGSGGILVTPTSTGGNTITGGVITGSAGGQLAIISGTSTGTFTLGSLIVDNGASTAVTISAPVGGTFNISNGNNSYSGGTFFNGGKTPTTVSAAGTPFGTGTLTLGNQVAGNVAAGGISFGSGNYAFGLLASALGVNTDNGNIGTNGGNAILTMIGTPNQTALFNGTFGTEAGGRQQSVALDGGTEIFGLPTNGGTFNGIATFAVNGGTLQFGDGFSGTVQNDTSNGTSVTLGGGTFVELGNVVGLYNQTFTAGLKVSAGGSTVTVNANGGAGTVFSPGAIIRTSGATVNFNLPSGTQTATNGITTTTLNTNGILGGYATVSGTDWATNATNTSGGNIIALPAASYTASTAGTTAPGTGTNVDFQASNTTAFATQSINSLRFNTAGANTLTNAGTLTISSGGVLETANVGSGNATTITGGTLQGSAQDLVVIQNNAAGVSSALTINSQIVANGTSGLTKSGPGELILAPTAANTFTGGMYLNGGVLNTTTNGIGAAGSFTFNGGTLQAANTISSAKNVAIGATGGTIDTNGNAVTLSGVVSGTPSGGAGALGGFNSTGAFAFTKAGAGTLTLSNVANTFGGGLVINNGTVADGSASGSGTFGTGYVTFGTSNTPTMSLGSHNVTVAGLIGSGSNGIVTGGVAGMPVVTLNGVSTQTFGGVIQNGSATVGVTLNLSNPTESQILTNTNTYTGVTTLTAGTLQLGNGTTGNDGSLASASIVNNSALVYNTFGATSTNGAISGTGSVTKIGAGTVTLSGANTYAGVTTISGGTLAASGTGTNKALGGTTNIAVNNAGTLLLGAANQVNAAAPITMGTTTTSGTLSVAAGANQGNAETLTAGTAAGGPTVAGLGALTLNSTSTLNYAGSGTTLVFGVFTANGNVLNVTGASNITATPDGLNSGAATDDRLVFSNGGNTANDAALTSFNFGSGPGVGVFEVNLDNGFYEVVVPEPSTWVGGMFLVGTAVWQFRRRSRKVLS